MSDRTELQKVACFDVDGTIFRSSLLIEIVDVLIEQGSFPESARDTFRVREEEWRDRKGDYESYIEAVVRAFMGHLKGLSVADFDRASTIVIERNHDRVYRYTRDLLTQLKQDGYFLLAISHSPKWLLDKFCGEYGFDKVYGKRYVIDDTDHFTGAIVDDAVFENKAAISGSVRSRGGSIRPVSAERGGRGYIGRPDHGCARSRWSTRGQNLQQKVPSSAP
jgi:HAD superfamily phosphoserine phosphatase-like hydrolase